MKIRYISLIIAFLLALSSTAAIVPVALAVTSLTAPTITPSTSAFASGQTVTLDVAWSGGSTPFEVSLYSSPTSFCYSGSTPVASHTPATSPYSFSVSPTATTYYCATVQSGSTVTTSGTAELYEVSAVTATITPSAPTVDAPQGITLTAIPSGGLAPYTYQWFNPGLPTPNCVVNPVTSAQSTPSYATGPVAGTAYYDVLVTDSTPGTPANSYCAAVTIVSDASLTITTYTVSPTVLDLGHSATVTASLVWNGGTSPFSVTLYSGTSSTCSADTTVVAGTTPANPQTGLTGTSASFTFSPPSSNSYYCAKITDSAYSPVTVESTTSSLTVNPALTAPTMVLTPDVADSGSIPTPLSATVSWLGGTSMYTVTITSGSNAACTEDPEPVALLSGGSPVSGTTDTVTFAAPSSSSSTYYCATVTDSSMPAFSVQQVTASLFSVDSPLSFTGTTITPAFIDVSTPTTVTYTASWSGGTGPYTVTLYSTVYPTACTASGTEVAVLPGFNPITDTTTTTAKFIFASPSGSPGTVVQYCAVVTDSLGIQITSQSAPYLQSLELNANLASPTLSLSPSPEIDQGQTTTVTATIGWASGTSTFTVKLTSGPTSNCLTDTTTVASTTPSNPQSGLTGSSAAFTFTSPSTDTWYCATITDSSSESVTSTAMEFMVNSPLTLSITPALSTIDAGASETLTAVAASGTPSYTYQWYAGSSTCSAADALSGQTASAYDTGVLTSTTVYSVKVTDSSVGTPASLSSACASATVNVQYGPTGIATDPYNGYVYVLTLGDPYDTPGNVTIISGSSNTLVNPGITVGIQPWGIAITNSYSGYPDGLIYVTNSNSTSDSVSVIDAATSSVITTIALPAGSDPEGIAVDTCFNLAYVADHGTDSVSVIDTNPADTGTFDTVVANIAVGTGPQSVAVMNTGVCATAPSTVFVTNYGSDSVSAIQVSNSNAGSPYWQYAVTIIPVGTSPWGVATNPSSGLVYVTNSGSDSISVIDAATLGVVSTITTAGTPEGIAVDTATTPYATVYVALTNLNVAWAITLSPSPTFKTIPLPLGSSPASVELFGSPYNYAYVSNPGSNVISVIDINPSDATFDTVVATVIV